MKDDQNKRRPKLKMKKNDDEQNGRQPKWTTTKMEDDQNGIKEELSYGASFFNYARFFNKISISSQWFLQRERESCILALQDFFFYFSILFILFLPIMVHPSWFGLACLRCDSSQGSVLTSLLEQF